ncbi:MAG: T9SS type A sorting domain-containing protein, partial [Candidatus Cloacimonetes bacterium]|nr:T9SS type A sorting domain-containing protein [Candidatus Cloacimonadota bacterium]
NRDDFIIYTSCSYPHYPYSPKIVYTLSDGVSNSDHSIPQAQFAVYSYPNPFSDKSTITAKIPEPGQCKLGIYNIKGQRVRTHNISAKTAGDHAFQWDAKDDDGNQVCGGVYFVVLEKGKYKSSSKILYLR